MKNTFLFIFCVCVLAVDCILDKPCETFTGGPGRCLALDACQPIVNMLQRLQYSIRMTVLHQSHCGFDELRTDVPKVCCPIPTTTPDNLKVSTPPAIVTIPASTVTTQPPIVTPQPPIVTSQPASTTTEPLIFTTQPQIITTQPAIITTQPPIKTTQPPIITTQPTIITTNPLIITTQTPIKSTQPPIISTQPSVITTQPPTITTQPPIITTQPPIVTTQPAIVTTQPAIITTQPPTIATHPPIVTTQPAINTTQPPIITTQPPTIATQPPIVTTQPAINTTLPPIITTQPPTIATQPPIVTTTKPKVPTASPRLQPDLEQIVNNLITIESVGETCITVSNSTGACKDIYFCDELLHIAKTASKDPGARELLQRSACGFDMIRPKVCCPMANVPVAPPPVKTTPLPSIYTSRPSLDLRKRPSEAAREYLPTLPEPPVCGVSNGSLGRVVGGVTAKLGALPWMALIAYKDKLKQTGVDWKCGGSLVSIRHVLTAAHCIHNMEDSIWLVRLGELDLARESDGASPVDILIKETIKHDQYTANKVIINDIGVLVLERDVTFTAYIRPICLPVTSTHRSMTYEGYNPFVAGWGNLRTNSISATHLQVAQVTVTSQETCEKAYREVTGLFDRALCAGVPGGKADSCQGDSGGPLILPLRIPTDPHYYYYEVGVVSAGRRCGDQAGSPGVYARLSYYMTWIEQQLLGTS